MLKVKINSTTYNLFWLQCVIFAVLVMSKIYDYDSVSWFWLFSPFIIPYIFVLVFCVFIFIIAKLSGVSIKITRKAQLKS